MKKIFVIGCISNDVIHIDSTNSTFEVKGGAAYYTAIAIRALGIVPTVLAPRLINSNISNEQGIVLFDWVGPIVGNEDFPSLEIRHHGNDKATLCSASWGAEYKLEPLLLPDNLADYAIVHIAALGSAVKQLEFVEYIKKTSPGCKISMGTYARLAYNETEIVRKLVQMSDYVFLNENEAAAVFQKNVFPLEAKPEQIICVTRGKEGAQIYTSNDILYLSGKCVNEIDPTGAGDTFAGILIASLAKGQSLEKSAELAIEYSALSITTAGAKAMEGLIF